MIASREMAAKPAQIWESLKEEGAVVITKNGQPEGVFVSTSGDTWLEDIQDILFARARRATQQLRKHAVQSGNHSLSMDDIDTEIQAVRDSRSE